jgi:hypothetical protein
MTRASGFRFNHCRQSLNRASFSEGARRRVLPPEIAFSPRPADPWGHAAAHYVGAGRVPYVDCHGGRWLSVLSGGTAAEPGFWEQQESAVMRIFWTLCTSFCRSRLEGRRDRSPHRSQSLFSVLGSAMKRDSGSGDSRIKRTVNCPPDMKRRGLSRRG